MQSDITSRQPACNVVTTHRSRRIAATSICKCCCSTKSSCWRTPQLDDTVLRLFAYQDAALHAPCADALPPAMPCRPTATWHRRRRRPRTGARCAPACRRRSWPRYYLHLTSAKSPTCLLCACSDQHRLRSYGSNCYGTQIWVCFCPHCLFVLPDGASCDACGGLPQSIAEYGRQTGDHTAHRPLP